MRHIALAGATIAVNDALAAPLEWRGGGNVQGNGKIAGSGDVYYYGAAKVNRTVVGSGGTRRLGDAPK